MAAQIGTPYNRPMGPDQTECHEGPRIHFDRPRAGTLAPSPPSFPRLGPPFCGRVQSLCDGLGGAFKFRPLDFGPR